MQPGHDAIYIVTQTPARANAIKQAIALRGFDEVLCMPFEQASDMLAGNPPALVIMDGEGNPGKIAQLVTRLPGLSKSLVIHEHFDEELFVTCHDHGVRDFLVAPVPDVYLVSRVLRALQECRLEELVKQKEDLLKELGVLSERSGVFTTSYFLKLLQQEAKVSPAAPDALSLLMVQLQGDIHALPEIRKNQLLFKVASVIKECARGFDLTGEYLMDKFAVILPRTGKAGSQALARRLHERLDGLAFGSGNEQFVLQVRIGMAEYAGCRHYEDLLNRALADLQSTPESLTR